MLRSTMKQQPTKTKKMPRYTYDRVLGSGAFADVWLAVDESSGKQVAIKCIKPHAKSSSAQYEYYIGKSLKHKHIVKTHNYVKTKSGKHLLVQDYVAGGELFDLIENDYGMEEKLARVYIGQVATALSYMHSRGVVHRDVKPENILVDNKEGAKLCDFGMAANAGDASRRGVGTVPYMPPEVLASPKVYEVTTAYDTWSLGVCLYVLLVGDFPWMKATRDDPEYSAYLAGRRDGPWSSFTPELVKLFEMMLAPTPKERCSLDEIHTLLFKPFFGIGRPNQTVREPIATSDSDCSVLSSSSTSSSSSLTCTNGNEEDPVWLRDLMKTPPSARKE